SESSRKRATARPSESWSSASTAPLHFNSTRASLFGATPSFSFTAARKTTMKMLTRALLFASSAAAGVAALRDKGYEVLTHSFDGEPDYTFVEAYRDVPVTDDVYSSACAELDHVNDIVEAFGGGADDCGPPPVGHVPFQYETYRGAFDG